MCKSIEIKSVTPPGKGEKGAWKFTFTVPGDPENKLHKAKFWPRAPWKDSIKTGDVGEAKFETVAGGEIPDKPGEKFPDEKFLKTWNGIDCPEPESKFKSPNSKFGGAPRGKSEQEILADLAAHARSHAIAGMGLAVSTDRAKVDLYFEAVEAFALEDINAMIDLINSGKGKLK